jgi:hypothetical protein
MFYKLVPGPIVLSVYMFFAPSSVRLDRWISEEYSVNPSMERNSWDGPTSGSRFLTVSFHKR